MPIVILLTPLKHKDPTTTENQQEHPGTLYCDLSKRILLIDGYHLLHKGYYGSLKRKKILTNRDGEILNALCVFVAKMIDFSNSGKYHTVIVTFDVASKDCWRRELYPDYKATRKETPDDLKPQMQLVRKLKR
jgi:DNA polymerase-1